VSSSDCLPCSLLQRGTRFYQTVRVVHYYKGEREFMRFSSLFIIINGDVTSWVSMCCSLLQTGTFLHQFVSVFHYYKWVRDFIRLSALFIVTKGTRLHHNVCVVHYYKLESDFMRLHCSLWQMGTWFHEIVCVNSSDCLRCSLLHWGTWLHQIALFIITNGNVVSLDWSAIIIRNSNVISSDFC